MIIELVSMVTTPEKREDLGKALSSFLAMTRTEPGCLAGLLYQDWSDESVFYLESRWQTVSDLTHHIRMDAYKRLLQLMELAEEPPIIEFLTVSEVRGLDFVKAVREASRFNSPLDSTDSAPLPPSRYYRG